MNFWTAVFMLAIFMALMCGIFVGIESGNQGYALATMSGLLSMLIAIACIGNEIQLAVDDLSKSMNNKKD